MGSASGMTSTVFSETRGNGPDLVLLHGWGLNSGVWQTVSNALQAHYRVTYIDLPGFGRNANTYPESYTLGNVAEYVSTCIPEGAFLLGWSLGGLVAQHIALQSTSLRGLITVASTPRFPEHDNWPGIKQGVLRTFEKQLERDFSKTLDRFLAIQAMGSVSAREDIKTIRRHIEHYPLPSPSALQNGLAILAATDLRQQVSGITAPWLQLYGRLDSLVPHSAMECISALNPRAEQRLFAHASHAPFISHPEAFLECLFEWTARYV